MHSRLVEKGILAALLALVALVVIACATPTPISPPTVGTQEITIYFLDENKFASGETPFEVPVTRTIHEDANPIMAVMAAYFEGPIPSEEEQGLVALYHGFTGVRDLRIEGDTAYVYLEGE